MAAIRMIHPEHGETNAYDTGEIDRLKGYGWVVEEVRRKPKIETPAPVGPVITQDAPVRRKPGPKPKK